MTTSSSANTPGTFVHYVNLPGSPTVITSCHPVKNADPDNLMPRGGGAFLAEVDGNLVCIGQPGGSLVKVHWHSKFRGPDFTPVPFKPGFPR